MERDRCKYCKHFELVETERDKNVHDAPERIGFCVFAPPRRTKGEFTPESLENQKLTGRVWPVVRADWHCSHQEQDPLRRTPPPDGASLEDIGISIS